MTLLETTKADHLSDENHDRCVGQGGDSIAALLLRQTNTSLKPSRMVSGRAPRKGGAQLSADQGPHETHEDIVGASGGVNASAPISEAKYPLNPISVVPRRGGRKAAAPISLDRHDAETHLGSVETGLSFSGEPTNSAPSISMIPTAKVARGPRKGAKIRAGRGKDDNHSFSARSVGDEVHSEIDAHRDDDFIAETIHQIVLGYRNYLPWEMDQNTTILRLMAMCRREVGGDPASNKKRGAALYSDLRDRFLASQKAQAKAKTEEALTAAIVDGEDVRQEIVNCIGLAALARFAHMHQLEKPRNEAQRVVEKLTESLPIWVEWGVGVKGLSSWGLGKIIACAQSQDAETCPHTFSVGNYATVSKLWKRFGLAVIAGERQRKKSDADDALEHGYSPQRRAVLWNIENGLIGGMGKGSRPFLGEDIDKREDWSPHQRMFVRFLREEVTKVTDNWNGPEHAREPVADKETGELKESFSKHAFNRAKRRVGKQFLIELWSAWRKLMPTSAAGDRCISDSHDPHVPGRVSEKHSNS